jgi:hypothetical protein
MRTFAALAFWAITLFLTVAGLVHLFNENSNDFVNACFMVFIAFCCLMIAASKP